MEADPTSTGVAVVTGAARGLGAGIARAAAAAGMTVVVADRDAAGATEQAGELTAAGHHAVAVATDVTDYASVERLADVAFTLGAPVRLLANNAGIEHVGLLWEGDPARWRELLAVNVDGVYHGVRAFVPRLLEQGSPAALLHTASIAAFTTGPHQGAYQVSKRAVLALSECLEAELAAVGAPITVTVGLPGPLATQIFELPEPDAEGSAAALGMLQRLVGRRGVDPDDAGRLLYDAAMSGRRWVTTDVAGLRSFLDLFRASLAAADETLGGPDGAGSTWTPRPGPQ